MRTPAVGEVWTSGRRHWRCVETVGEVGPNEPLRRWVCTRTNLRGRAGREELGAVGMFGDRYVAMNWRPLDLQPVPETGGCEL
jgi:hypothetical protein